MAIHAHPDTLETETGLTTRKVGAGYFLSLDGVLRLPNGSSPRGTTKRMPAAPIGSPPRRLPRAPLGGLAADTVSCVGTGDGPRRATRYRTVAPSRETTATSPCFSSSRRARTFQADISAVTCEMFARSACTARRDTSIDPTPRSCHSSTTATATSADVGSSGSRTNLATPTGSPRPRVTAMSASWLRWSTSVRQHSSSADNVRFG